MILLTNDGAFAESLQKNDQVLRAYQIKVKGHPTEDDLEKLRRGSRAQNREIRPHSVRMARELANKATIEVVMIGSGGADLKMLFELKGFLVEKITRISIGHLTLRGIEPGQYKLLKKSQVEALLTQPELGARLIDHNAAKRPEGVSPATMGQFGTKAHRLQQEREKREGLRRPPGETPKIKPATSAGRVTQALAKTGKPELSKYFQGTEEADEAPARRAPRGPHKLGARPVGPSKRKPRPPLGASKSSSFGKAGEGASAAGRKPSRGGAKSTTGSKKPGFRR